jgi:hypothetical protein
VSSLQHTNELIELTTEKVCTETKMITKKRLHGKKFKQNGKMMQPE